METRERYNHLNTYYKNKFAERTLKICIDAGFSCPNRDGTLSNSGCIFCSEKGSGELIKYSSQHIENQVTNFLNSYRGKRANKFIAYFQNFTNTYDTLENLKEKYDSALNANDKIVGLSVALGMGITQAPAALANFPEWVTMIFGKSPVVMATIMAILLNLVLPKEEKK